MILMFFFRDLLLWMSFAVLFFSSFLHIADLLNMSVRFFFICLLCSRWWIFMHQVVKRILR